MASATASGMRCSLAIAAPGACGAAVTLTQRYLCPKSVDHLRLCITANLATRKRQYAVLTAQVFLNSAMSLRCSLHSSARVSLIANAYQNLNSALVDTEKKKNRENVEELPEPEPTNTTDIPRKFRLDAKTGAFQQLPMVSPSHEVLGSAIRKAKMVRPTKGINNVAKRERNRGAKQLDALMKELALPLRGYIQSFPRRQQLHAYESALLELTLGQGEYEQVLERVDLLRKRIVDVGKNYASICAKTTTKREAEERLTEGFTRLEEVFKKQGSAVDDLMEQAKKLRAVPVISLRTPTLCLVGAPNVGKSSLVRILSSGKPEVCNYQFTTRGISLGHFEIESRRFQVTDTPGLLERTDEERNNMEKLTLAALSHLPTSILYVHDLTGECGSSAAKQFNIYTEMKKRYFDRPWLDVVSKADLLPPVSPGSSSSIKEPIDSYMQSGPSGALRVSVETGEGVDELVNRVHDLLVQAHPDESKDEESTRETAQPDPSYVKPAQEFYYPAWPRKQEN